MDRRSILRTGLDLGYAIISNDGSPRSALHGLSVEDLDRTTCSRVDLVVHHVLQPLVVGGPEEDLRGQFAAREPVI